MIGTQAVKSRKKSTAPDRADPTPERMRIAGRDYERGDTGQLTMRDNPLERALSRGVITSGQYNAGIKYRHHWFRAGLSDPIGSIDLNRVFASDLGGFSGMAKTENQVFHRQQYREAVEHVGKTGAFVLDWAVCRDQSLEVVGYTLGWESKPQAMAAACERMVTALERLCDLWGI